MSRRHELGVGVLVLAAGGLLTWMALQVGAVRGPGELVDLTVRMTDAAGLGEGSIVSVAGVQVGRITRLRLEGTEAVADVQIDASAQVRANARFHVRARSLLGEKYLAIEPGADPAAALLADGDVITGVPVQVDVDELLAAISPLVEAIDPAALRALSDAVRADPERAKRMLEDAEATLRNARVASEALPALVADGSATLAAARRAALTADRSLSELAPLAKDARGTALRLDALLAAVPPERVSTLLAELQAAIGAGRATLEHLDGSTADLRELLRKANAIDRAALDRFALQRGVYVRFLRPDPDSMGEGDDPAGDTSGEARRPKKRKKR